MPALSWFAPKIKASGAASLLPKTQLRRDSEFLLRPEDDPRTTQVIRREFHEHFITRQHTDAILAHLPGGVREDHVVIVQLHAEHGIREEFNDLAAELDHVFFRHASSWVADARGRARGERERGGTWS